jgi:uncharacterized protein (DUF2126 family)
MEPGVLAPEETLERGHGSCRDFAWLLVQVMRHLGVAARFVSGYSIQTKPDLAPLEGPAGVTVDCTDLHAWAEVFLPGAGWVGMDATSGLFAGEGHIPLASTADPSAAAPVTGSFSFEPRREGDKVAEALSFTMSVERVDERPRPTKPFSESDWRDILALGEEVDAALEAGDVRLTMGGEPTFVSIDDRDGDEWSTAALGPKKRALAEDLVERLADRFAPGGLIHYGQGKWYPGEPLPRWALSCYFRRDGQPVWRRRELVARSEGGHGAAEAKRFLEALAGELGVDAGHVAAAFEDVWYHLWRERRLPVNVDPFDSRLDDATERARLRQVFDQGLASPVGYALPLRPVSSLDGEIRFESGAWLFRDQRLYLLPGDSPLGFRLPLDSLPFTAPEDRDGGDAADPTAAKPPLDPGRIIAQQARARSQAAHAAHAAQAARAAPAAGPTAGAPGGHGDLAAPRQVVRTAICVEPRSGILHVFMPPTTTIEQYLAIVAAVEATAEELSLPVRVEGYHPPADHRLERFSVTPDPGVIEVNIHPARSFAELVDRTTSLYECARQSRLGPEKFLLDGRHVGTGGGNHIVIGGPTPGDSPLLRRPDLLRSLIGYWLNHPSLSYLFSGLFVGPTSQAPRIDEARHDSVRELEIAFAELDRHGPEAVAARPWLADRLLRNLLVDVTGNTHRAELCIDKLWSPDSAAGRQGLLELRAFEMPPDARMSVAQQLLLRALVARFWRSPYQTPPVRWGTALVDRFTLPHFVGADFADVLADLDRAGFHLRPRWYEAQHEFKFPLVGRVAADNVELTLRQAIEPWHVLGEEVAAGGTARFVDSSLERLEVRVRGAVEGRHIVACNGRRVPLHATGTVGELVAGVRYRAWQPPSALHPTIGVHAPLVFDLLDTWAGRATVGCTYHVAHPGGRAYDRLPENALEAEARRQARFFPFGHTPGPQAAPPAELDPDLPLTLDLRRPPPA